MMATTIISDKPDMSDPLNQFTLVGVKRYHVDAKTAAMQQTGMAVRLSDKATPDEILDAEASCLTSINLFLRRMPTWNGAFLTGQ